MGTTTRLAAAVGLALTVHAGMAMAQTQERLKEQGTEEIADSDGGDANDSKRCTEYRRFSPRTDSVARDADPCQTLLEDGGSLRGALADHGFGYTLSLNPKYSYDVLGHNAANQSYNGQNPTYRLGSVLKVTYDLTRLGWGGDAQFIGSVSYNAGSYSSGSPNFLTMQSFAVNQKFMDDRLTVQYGYFTLIREYYGMVLGGNANSAANGPNSVIPASTGLTLFSPSPAFLINIKDRTKRWYNQASVSRSGSPNRFQYDLDQNPTGFKVKVPGSRALLVDEFGFKRESGRAGQRSLWLRAGAIYNFSHYTDYRNGGTTGSNYGAYLAGTGQLTQPEGRGRRGLYWDAKFNYAPEDRNQYAGDVQLTTFYIAPFDSRPRDMMALGLSRSFFSKYARAQRQARGLTAEHFSTAVSFSYAANVTRGLYWVNSLTYQQGPTFAPKRPDVLILQSAFSLAF